MDYIIVGLLTVIAVSELYRTFLGLRKATQKDHFKSKLRQTKTLIWDLQFKVFKTREIRESIRQEYDYMKSRIETLTSQVTNFPKDGDQAEKARIEDQIVLAKRDEERFLQQMKQLDLEIEGARPSEEYPSGVEGVTHQIDSLKELEKMLEDYIVEL